MKKLLIAAIGASLLAAPAAFAAPAFNGHGHYAPPAAHASAKVVTRSRTVQYRGWNRGERFDRRQVRTYGVISNPHAYRLHEAPRGYRWVRADRDAVLVGITSGVIASVIANAFN